MFYFELSCLVGTQDASSQLTGLGFGDPSTPSFHLVNLYFAPVKVSAVQREREAKGKKGGGPVESTRVLDLESKFFMFNTASA